ncbi:MAG TPA: CHRD domain-containing protein [Bacteroidota bacterium]|nr:CHRD domain-containing protein [Bacteroidota bacterium]
MKGRLLFPLGLMLVAFCPCAVFAQIHFTATLDGAQEGGVVTSATGTGSFDLSEDFTQLHYIISYQGLSGPLTGGHFHTGLPGVAGPVVKPIATAGRPAFSTVSGTWSTSDVANTLTPALIDSLLAGKMYVNFHTSANPGGEIRGQLNLATSLHFEALLSGAQETPPDTFKGGGTAVVVLNKWRNEIDYWITYRGLSDSATGGHFHTGAAGIGGPVVKGLITGKGPKSNTLNGSWKLTDGTQPLTNALIDSLIAGNMYVNFHTVNKPGGEIRGQLVLKGGTGFVASLDGAHESPPDTFKGTGTGSFILNAARNQVTYNITYIGLSTNITGGHIHAGGPSLPTGPVVKPLGTAGDSSEFTDTGTWKTTDGTNPLTTALVDSMLIGSTYANFHTTNKPGGEIRGWLNSTTGEGFTARLDGSQESASDTSRGVGTGSFSLTPGRDTVSYSITYYGLTGTTSAGHFHIAPAGVGGPVVKSITGAAGSAMTYTGNWTTTDASQALTLAYAESLFVGKVYVNFHTALYPGGEIRGQLQYGSDVVASVSPVSGVLPGQFHLDQNFPNPFNPATVIGFQISKSSQVSLIVYNILGERVVTLVDGVKAPGAYQVKFDASRLSSGVYFYRLTADGALLETRKMMLLR